MKFKGLLVIFCLCFSNLYLDAASPHAYVKDNIWDQVEPFLIPDDHPVKEQLDEIFFKKRAIVSIKSMEKAGFENVVPQRFTHIIVTKHPEIPGYVFKVYLDAQRYYANKPEYYFYIKRATGARKIQALLDEKDWNHQFKVPKKWIYVVPEEPSPPDELVRKNFILVEEDMDIYDNSTNCKYWKSDFVTKELIERFHYIVYELGLSDCAKPANAPFSRDGRIAFVDTQTYDSWPISYYKITPYLSKEIRSYWKKLIKTDKK